MVWYILLPGFHQWIFPIQVVLGWKQVDFAVFGYKVLLEIDGMIPRSRFREAFCRLLVKYVLVVQYFSRKHLVECLLLFVSWFLDGKFLWYAGFWVNPDFFQGVDVVHFEYCQCSVVIWGFFFVVYCFFFFFYGFCDCFFVYFLYCGHFCNFNWFCCCLLVWFYCGGRFPPPVWWVTSSRYLWFMFLLLGYACHQLGNCNQGLVFDFLFMFLVSMSVCEVVCCGCSRELDSSCAPFNLGVMFLEPW